MAGSIPLRLQDTKQAERLAGSLLLRSRSGGPIGILSPRNPVATVSVSLSSAPAPSNGLDGFL